MLARRLTCNVQALVANMRVANIPVLAPCHSQISTPKLTTAKPPKNAFGSRVSVWPWSGAPKKTADRTILIGKSRALFIIPCNPIGVVAVANSPLLSPPTRLPSLCSNKYASPRQTTRVKINSLALPRHKFVKLFMLRSIIANLTLVL